MHTEKLSFEKHQLEADYELTTDDHELTNSTLTEQPPQEEVDYLQVRKVHTMMPHMYTHIQSNQATNYDVSLIIIILLL